MEGHAVGQGGGGGSVEDVWETLVPSAPLL